jgi:hydrogenase/urease accessory protein HupE
MESIVRCVRSLYLIWVNFALLLLLALPAEAHDPGFSTATVTVEDQRLEIALEFAKQDAVFILPAIANSAGIETPEGFQSVRSGLESVIANGFNIYLGNERLAPLQTTARLKDRKSLEILLRFRRTNATQIRLQSTLLERFPLGHREFLSVQTATGASLAEALLSAKKNSAQISLPAVATLTVSSREEPSLLEFLKLGVEHILTGYDHLLFLFGLMVVCRDLRSILTVITSFTVAHSITLVLATLDIVRLPGKIVEPVIAASIAYVGIENLFRGDSRKWRSLIAFCFGLVHGLGFADALRELGINSGRFGIVVPLVGFNLGVEAGQLCVAAIVLPILWNLRKNPVFVRRWVPVCSAAVAFAGSYWMIERIIQN